MCRLCNVETKAQPVKKLASNPCILCLAAVSFLGKCGLGQVIPLPPTQTDVPTLDSNATSFQITPQEGNVASAQEMPVAESIAPSPVQTLVPAIQPRIVGSTSIGDKIWSLNFSDAPWSTVLRELAKSMGSSLSMAYDPVGTFTYYDEQRYSVSEVIDILNDHLIRQGAILIRNEQRLTVVSTQQPINDSIVPFVSIAEIDWVGRNEIAGTAIPIKGVDASQAVSEIALVKSPIGQVRSFANSQRIVIIDTGTHLRRIRDLLLQTGFARSDAMSNVYQLKHAKAEDVAKSINDFLTGNTSSDLNRMSQVNSGMDSDRVVAEKTTNSLIIRGSQRPFRLSCESFVN